MLTSIRALEASLVSLIPISFLRRAIEQAGYQAQEINQEISFIELKIPACLFKIISQHQVLCWMVFGSPYLQKVFFFFSLQDYLLFAE